MINELDKRASWYSRPSAERSVITLCLQNMEDYISSASKLSTQDFLCSNNRALFTCLESLSSMGVNSFDLTVVATTLNEFGMLESVGGYDYVDALFRSEVSRSNLDVYIKQVLDASLLYKLEGTLKKSADFVHDSANSTDTKVDSIVADVENSILGVALETLKVSDGLNISDGLVELLKEYESNPSSIRGLRSGFPILDRVLNGFVPGGLYVVAARPKCGKSTVLANWATHMCVAQSVPILFIDSEMTFKEDFQPRIISYLSGVPERIIKNGLYVNDKKQHESVYYAVEIMNKMKFIHKYMPGFRMDDVKSVVRKYYAKYKIGALFFDYIKMVELNDNFNETQTLGYITSTLKDIAGTLDIPVISAVQINRTGEGKSRISSDQIADSDRVLRYCNVLMSLAPKTKKEIDAEGINCGTHRLQILDNRGGSNFYSGIDILFKRSILTAQEAPTQSSDSLIEQRRVEDEKSV